MRVVRRREEVEILNLIGATKGFIRSPIIIEAFIYTLFGVIVGWAIAFIAVLYLAPTVVAYFGESRFCQEIWHWNFRTFWNNFGIGSCGRFHFGYCRKFIGRFESQKSKMMYVKKKFFLLLPAVGLFLFASIVRAQTCSSETDCNTLIQQYSDQVTKLQGQANTLSNQIAQFNVQIKLTTLKISQTEDTNFTPWRKN